MIKNIVFDLGNVLVSFKPEDYLDNNGYGEEAKNIILNEIFRGPEWKKLDNGDITVSEAIISIAIRTQMQIAEIEAVFDLRSKIIIPLDHNTILLPGLKERGFKLYYLSNFPDDIFDAFYNKYEFFRYFDGGIISARAGVSKPDLKIFKILLEKYSLSPGESLFIDDSETNIAAGKLSGMKVLHVIIAKELPELLESALGKI